MFEAVETVLANPPLYAAMSEDRVSGSSMAETSDLNITNKDVYEFYKTYKDSASSTSIADRFLNHFGVNSSANPMTLYKKIKSVYELCTKKLKTSAKKTEFLSRKFDMPLSRFEWATLKDTPRKRALKEKLRKEKQVRKDLKRKFLSLEEEKISVDKQLEEQVHIYTLTAEELANVLSNFHKDISDLKEDKATLQSKLDEMEKNYQDKTKLLDSIQEKIIKSSAKVKNLKRVVKRSKATISEQKSVLETQDKQIMELVAGSDAKLNEIKKELCEKVEHLKVLESKVAELKNEKIRLTKSISYLKKKCEGRNSCFLEIREKNAKEIESLESKILLLQKENEELEKLSQLFEDPKIKTFAEGRYNNEVREVIMELVSCNVSLSQIDNVIRTVLQKLAGKDVEKLPSQALKSRIALEARHIVDYQVATAVLQDADPHKLVGNCLHGDGTTKFHKHYQGFQVTTAEGQTLSLGMLQMGGATAEDLVEALTVKLNDLAHALSMDNKNEREARVKDLILSIKNTMSDRASVNKKFNEEFDILREKVAREVIKNFKDLSDSEKESVLQVGHFYCGLHLIVNFGSEADTALKTVEAAMLEGKNPYSFKSSESGTFRLIRTICKAFEEHGSDEAGVASHFNTFLLGKGEESNLASFRGNRINIIFYNATAAFYHREHFSEFLRKWPDANRLLKSVDFDLNCEVYLAGAKALGIVDKIITAPLWRLLESSVGIGEMGNHYNKLQLSLQKWQQDPTPLMKGEVVFDEKLAPINRDKRYEALFKNPNDSIDEITKQTLEILCAHFLILLERQVADQLPGGNFFQPLAEKQQATSSVPKTNVVSERDFAQLDLQLRIKPSARMVTHEALIMWRNNKTVSWLEKLSQQEKEKLLADARKSARSWIIEKHKERKEFVLKRKEEKLKEKQEKQEKDKQKKEEKAIDIVNASNNLLRYGGAWTSVKQMDEILAVLMEPKDAIIAQLKFHKAAGSKAPQPYYFQSETRAGGNRTVFSLEEMKSHLREIIHLNNLADKSTSSSSEPHLSMRKDWEDRLTEEKNKVSKKLTIARTKKDVQSSQSLLGAYVENPMLLLGRRFKHKIKETADDAPQWFDGTVKRIDKLLDNKLKTRYFVTYDLDGDEELFSMPLLQDLKRGDLVIL